tara:strand:+ start:121 stop:471 length:351 start_codon:yes stop_codon:yes gene_type:complete
MNNTRLTKGYIKGRLVYLHPIALNRVRNAIIDMEIQEICNDHDSVVTIVKYGYTGWQDAGVTPLVATISQLGLFTINDFEEWLLDQCQESLQLSRPAVQRDLSVAGQLTLISNPPE